MKLLAISTLQRVQGAAATVMQAARRPLLVLALPLTLSLAACFHKDVMTDTADDVTANLLYQGPEGNLIISKEEVFQASSKSSGGGVTRISGYSEYRLSSYRIATGELAGRVELGEGMEEANELLGYSPGKIWMFSIVPELGLHYRDPITLEVKESWEQLSQKPGLNAFKPAKPEWPLINQYFVYDWASDRVLLTDEAGFKYALDPSDFSLQKVDIDMPRVDWDQAMFNTSGEFKKDDRIYLEGDPRKAISYAGIKNSTEMSFLFGEWIIDNDPLAELKRKKQLIAGMEAVIQAQQDTLSAFIAAHPGVEQEPKYGDKAYYEQRTLHWRLESMTRAIDGLKSNLKSEQRPNEKVLDYPLLTNDGHSAYIFHAAMVADTTHAVVSRVDLQNDSSWTMPWTTHLIGIYHNSSKADQAGAFETVYSKGNPEFDYEWGCTDGTYLVIIRQLHMLALDMKTGKLVWNIEI